MKWEYKVIGLSIRGSLWKGKKEEWQEEIDKLGREGWELVNIFALSISLGTTSGIVAIFKRPIK
jgi:hypothetical protein